MDLKNITLCSKALNFNPYQSWPMALPAMCWNGHIFAGFDSPLDHGLELKTQSNSDFVTLFKSFHPQLSLVELSRWHQSVTQSPEFRDENQFQWSEFFTAYGLRFNKSLEELLVKLVETPPSFQVWTHVKALGAKDLSILKSLDSMEPWENVFDFISQSKLSKSQGAQALEWILEILLIDPVNSTELMAELAGLVVPEHLMKSLYARRYPNSNTRDGQGERFTKQFPWPKSTIARWSRQGAKAGIEVKLFIKSTKDLEDKVKALQHVQGIMSRETNTPWTSN